MPLPERAQSAVSGMHGARVALLESRMGSELAALVRRHGGEPVGASSVREASLDCSAQVSQLVDDLVHGAFGAVIFFTGVGAKALLEEAERLGRLPALLDALNRVTTVCRGPKPVAVLKRQGVRISAVAPEPHTTADLLDTVCSLDLRGARVAVLHYGERNAAFVEALREQGMTVEELCLYEWLLPEDLEPLRSLVRDLVAGHVDVVAFTSQIQVRHLFQVATEMGVAQDLIKAFNGPMVVAAVGPTCASALLEVGVEPDVVPEHPKMGHMILAVKDHLQGRVKSDVEGVL